eukprot:SAG31_NODE_4224_length_3447_cov_2.493130_2_plen_142_part_00
MLAKSQLAVSNLEPTAGKKKKGKGKKGKSKKAPEPPPRQLIWIVYDAPPSTKESREYTVLLECLQWRTKRLERAYNAATSDDIDAHPDLLQRAASIQASLSQELEQAVKEDEAKRKKAAMAAAAKSGKKGKGKKKSGKKPA